ncbi:hypothetical protein PHLCEN_2v8809 [Hermanssonia centrifuga]|uniref:Pentatricopeptide repeat-containing protein n=1 Tax=Hermanssonia centrifuga TaxID=98765 RepID=A0A2R6NSJ7_9APHY|nr:hypothetical protein PHLCEN_2v8809 [Hermanssonia centrifuga]
MLRHVVHRIPCAPTLDFLLPRFYTSRQTLTKSLFSAPEKTFLKHIPQNSPSIPSTSKSPTSLQADDWDVNLSLPGAPHSLSDRKAELFNQVLPELKAALRKGDIPRSWKIWTLLTEEQWLQFLGPSQLNSYSRYIVEFTESHSSPGSISTDDLNAIDAMALFAAVGGAFGGLKARMLLYTKQRNPDAVDKLFTRYKTLLQEKGAWQDDIVEEPLQDDTQNFTDGTAKSASPKPRNAVRAEILFLAVAASAMQGSLRDAIHLVLQTPIAIPIASLPSFLADLAFDQALCNKTEDYVRGAMIARLLSRPALFAIQLSNLTKGLADKSMLHLYNTILRTLSEPDSWLTLDPSEVSAEKPVVLPRFAWASFLTGFLQCRRMDLAEKLWDDMARLGVIPDMDTWVALLNGYAGLRKVDRARQTWSLMVQQGLTPSPMAHKAIILAESKGGNPDEILMRLKDFQSQRTKKNFVDEPTALNVYNTGLHWLLFHARTDEARAILDQMHIEGPKPDVTTFNTFMRYYGRKKDMNGLAAMVQLMDAAGLTGDVFTYSIVLTALLPFRKDAPQVMFNLMRKHGVQPNVAMYTTIIDHLMKKQDEVMFRAALDLLNKMEMSTSKDVQPNEVTYTTILTGIHRNNRLDPAVVEETRQSISNKMKARNLMYSSVGYNILIKACLENPDAEGLQNALRYYREMVDRRMLIGNDTWYILLHGLMRRQEWRIADELNKGHYMD